MIDIMVSMGEDEIYSFTATDPETNTLYETTDKDWLQGLKRCLTWTQAPVSVSTADSMIVAEAAGASTDVSISSREYSELLSMQRELENLKNPVVE